MTDSWVLRKYREGDEQATLQLLNTVFSKRRSLEYWKWKCKNNPAGHPVIWLAECNGKIIGHYAMVPVTMKIGNAYITGSVGCGAATDPDHQGKGVFSSIVNRCCVDAAENDIPITYGFADRNLGPTYKRYERMGHISFVIRMMKVLDWQSVVATYAPSRLFSTAARALGRMTISQCSSRDLSLEKINRFDDRFDALWQEISRDFTVIAKRDKAYLNWRYMGHPEREQIVYAAVEDYRVLGYCVLAERQHQSLKLGLIVDIIGSQGRRNVVHRLIQKAVKHFEERDVDVVTCHLSEKHPYQGAFVSAGFIPHPRRKRALYCAVNLRGSTVDEKQAYSQALLLSQNHLLKKKSNWFMMHGDADYW
jgi:hypothetical protein